MKPRYCLACLIATSVLTLPGAAAQTQGIETIQQGCLQVDGKDDLVTTDLRIDQSVPGSPVTMEQQVATGAAGLLGYWRFNAHDGARVEDAGGNGNHGRLEGGAWME